MSLSVSLVSTQLQSGIIGTGCSFRRTRFLRLSCRNVSSDVHLAALLVKKTTEIHRG